MTVTSQPSSNFGLLATQFLSLCNDHAFKQMVLLMMLDRSVQIPMIGGDLQGVAIALFAAPFLLLAGPAGRTADSYPRRLVIVWSKYVEGAIMLLLSIALYTFDSVPLWILLGLLMAMAAQTAFLTPAKYGIILDLVGQERVSLTNGAMQMLGYLAIVGGAAIGGLMVSLQPNDLWLIGCWFVWVAILGIIASHMIARPGSESQNVYHGKRSQAKLTEIWKGIASHRYLRDAMIVYGFLWLIAGLYHPIINLFCIKHLQLSPLSTSLVLASSVLGIAMGCVIAGVIERRIPMVRCLRVTTIALVVCQGVLAMLTMMDWVLSASEIAIVLFALGLLTGAIVLPVHVFIQTQTPTPIRGQVLAAQSVVNWSAILISGLLYQLIRTSMQWSGAGIEWMFAALVIITSTGFWFLRPGPTGLLAIK